MKRESSKITGQAGSAALCGSEAGACAVGSVRARRGVDLRLARVLACLLMVGVGGCAARSGPTFEVPAGSYAKAFEITRDVLGEKRFVLERVDGRDGVITTAPKQTSGLATPWDAEQSTFRGEVEDLLHRQQRTVRVTFEPTDDGPDAASEDAARIGRVEVVIERWYVTGQRPSSRAVLQSTAAIDTVAARRGMPSAYPVAISRDESLAARLADAIAERLRRDRR